MKNFYQHIDIRIPSTINLIIALLALSGCFFSLWLCSHTNDWIYKVSSMITFGFLSNTVFSLLHEAVHANFHHNKKINYFFGNILASMFPTGFSFQRRCHLNHHRNNRTEFEIFETYHKDDNRVFRAITLYFVLTGIYWIFPFIGAVFLLLAPKSLGESQFTGKNNYQLGRIGSASMLRGFNNLPQGDIVRMRLEVVFMLLFQVGLFIFLKLNFFDWFLCYATFALLWSTLQYADHAFSPYDIRNGAWNLKVSPITKILFLNYHDHLAHHQHPHVPWIYLPRFVDKNVLKPTFWSIYFKMWKGPIKIDRIHTLTLDPELEMLIERENFNS